MLWKGLITGIRNFARKLRGSQGKSNPSVERVFAPLSRWRKKTWGRVTTICTTGDCLVDYLEIEPGGESSEHMHLESDNRFFVVSGSLIVVDFSRGVRHDLAAGESVVIPRQRWHEFRCPHGARVVETYTDLWEEKLRSVEDDIVRRNTE